MALSFACIWALSFFIINVVALAEAFAIKSSCSPQPFRSSVSRYKYNCNGRSSHPSIGTTVRLFESNNGKSVLADTESSSSSSSVEHYDTVIVGGGPAGLLSAIAAAQQLSSTGDGPPSPRIIVYDRLPPPPPPDNLVYTTDISKYYLLGLGHRGQRALQHFNVWDDVEKVRGSFNEFSVVQIIDPHFL